MEWYYWLLIGYGVLIFINTMVSYNKSRSRKEITDVFILLIIFVLGLVMTPFMWLISWFFYTNYNTPSYKTFTIHELTEENKIALKELGFKEGKWVSNNNIDYSGFRYNGGSICVQYNGRVFVKYLWFLSREQKFLIDKIRHLPKPLDFDKEIEELEKRIKDKKERQKYWKDDAQKEIDELQNKINELKELKKEQKQD